LGHLDVGEKSRDLGRAELRKIGASGIARSLVAIAFADDLIGLRATPEMENEGGRRISLRRNDHERHLVIATVDYPFRRAERLVIGPVFAAHGLGRRGLLMRPGRSGREQQEQPYGSMHHGFPASRLQSA